MNQRSEARVINFVLIPQPLMNPKRPLSRLDFDKKLVPIRLNRYDI